MKYILLLLTFNLYAAEVTSLDIELEKAIRTNRSRNVPDKLNEKTQNFINLNFEINLHKKIYWKNKISTEVTSEQFRYVGYDFSLGIHMSNDLDIYYRHYSGHMLDYQGDNNFREENSVGVRFKFK